MNHAAQQPTRPDGKADRRVGLPDYPVYVEDYGYGGRKGIVIAEDYLCGPRSMFTVRFDDGTPDRKVYGSVIHRYKDTADKMAFGAAETQETQG